MNPKPTNPTVNHRRSYGFTLVELLVVMAIIAIMAGMLMPQIGQSMEKVRRLACANNLQQIGLALRAYSQDNEGRYPFTGAAGDSANKHFALMFPRWINKEGVFICRSAAPRGYRADDVTDSHGSTRAETLKPGENSYAYAFGLGGPSTDDGPLACDQLADASVSAPKWAKQGVGSNHGEEGGNVLYMDGHVDFLQAGAQGSWPARKAKLQSLLGSKTCDPANAERSREDQ